MMPVEKKLNINDSPGSGMGNAFSGKNHAQNVTKLSFSSSQAQSPDSYTGKSKTGMAFKGGFTIPVREGYTKGFWNSPYATHWTDVLGLATSAISIVGYAVGGPGLIYESHVRAKNEKAKKAGNSPAPASVGLDRNAKPAFSSYSSYENSISTSVPNLLEQLIKGNPGNNAPNPLLPLLPDAIRSYKEGLNRGLNKQDGNKKGKSGKAGYDEGYGFIEPQTTFGKVGLVFSKAAIAVSGSAGFLTGLAMKIPLMAAGEVVGNLLAAPIVTTPLGYGLLSIGMGALFAGRAFDHNPKFMLNQVKYDNETAMGKVKYVAQNMGACIAETGRTIGEVGAKTAGLFSRTKEVRKDARNFFKFDFVGLNKSRITLTEEIFSNAKTIGKVGMKSPTHAMQLSGGILIASGIAMIGEYALERLGIIKNKTAEKARKGAFTFAKSGQFADNLGLIQYGLARSVQGAPILGVPVVLSGAIATSGASKVDEDSGKGKIWLALAFFFGLLGLERLIGTGNAFRDRNKLLKGATKAAAKSEQFMKAATSSVGRIVSVNITKIDGITGKDLGNVAHVAGGRDNAWLEIVKFFNKRHAVKVRQNIRAKGKAAEEYLAQSSNTVLRDTKKLTKAMPQALEETYTVGGFNKDKFVGNLEKWTDKNGDKLHKDTIEFLRKDGIVKVDTELEKEPDVVNTLVGLIGSDAKVSGKHLVPILEATSKDTMASSYAAKAADFALQDKKILKHLEQV
jgi:hypothetical protein